MMAVTRPAASATYELDDVTLARARRGELAAQRALVEHYERPVFALLARFTGRHLAADVEDLAQETFLRVFRELPSFRTDGRARLSTWILTIATRLAIDAGRRAGVRLRHQPEPPPAIETPERALERRALGQALAAALTELPETQRAALVLRAYHERSYQEIADTLECDVGTAKSRVARARSHLREALKGERHD